MNDDVVFKSRITKKEYKSLFFPLISTKTGAFIAIFCFLTGVSFFSFLLLGISSLVSFLYSVLISSFVTALLLFKQYVSFNNNLKQNPVLFEERQWSFNTTEIVIDLKSEKKRLEIDSILKIIEKENVFFLHLNKDECIALPKKFIPGNQVDEIKSFLKRKIK